MSVTIVPVPNTESSFTVTFNGCDEILTTVTSLAAEVDYWIQTINGSRFSSTIVGLDVEWRPSYGRIQNPAAILQLCIGRHCLIFLLIHADEIPRSLVDFLAGDRFTFVGVGIEEDVEKLVDYDLWAGNTRDLRRWAADKLGRVDLRQAGLATLAAVVMGVEIHKPTRVTMSRWDNYYLNLDQIGYACVDAYVSYEIGRLLL